MVQKDEDVRVPVADGVHQRAKMEFTVHMIGRNGLTFNRREFAVLAELAFRQPDRVIRVIALRVQQK